MSGRGKGAVSAVVGAAAAAGSRLRSAVAPSGDPGGTDDGAGRWLAVTVLTSPDALGAEQGWPEPLASIADAVQVEVVPAPGDRGVELRARPTEKGRLDDGDGRRTVRVALREAKQLIEVGEVLRIDPRPAGKRKDTPTGKVLDTAVSRAGSEGIL